MSLIVAATIVVAAAILTFAGIAVVIDRLGNSRWAFARPRSYQAAAPR